ncbi:MAG: response regulator [Bacteroidales bacterium]|nr:response regulator [Bacteroidales bacterium]
MKDNKTEQALRDEIAQQKETISQLQTQLHELSQSSEKEVEHRLALTINNIPLAILNTDRHGYITAANPAFARTFNILTADIVDKQNIKYFGPFQDTELQNKINQLIDNQINFDVELPYPDSNKETYFRCRGLVIKSRFTDALGFLIIIGDVSKRKITEHELIKALQKAEESDKLKTAFLANMSHEIRTPMNHIIGFTEFMKDLSLPTHEREEYAEIISDSSQVLLRLIDDIIDIAKIESDQMDLRKSVFLLNDVLQSVFRAFDNLRSRKDKAHIQFIYSVPNENNIIFMKTDAVRLQQIFNNLLNNAFKFTQRGHVSMGYTLKDDAVVFFVEDSGDGIADDQIENIFKRFRQIDYSLTKKYGGTGLGLSIVKGLVELLEGTIEVKSELGLGTRFQFEIPGLIQQSGLRTTKPSTKTMTQNWSKYTLLVVEDERTNYNLLMIMLRSSKVNLIWAKDGEQAIELMEKHQNEIDLVLMDIRLPLINGYDVTKIIKKMKPTVPVIAQTAYALDVEIQIAKDAGCSAYITKPIERQQLLDTIMAFLPSK